MPVALSNCNLANVCQYGGQAKGDGTQGCNCNLPVRSFSTKIKLGYEYDNSTPRYPSWYGGCSATGGICSNELISFYSMWESTRTDCNTKTMIFIGINQDLFPLAKEASEIKVTINGMQERFTDFFSSKTCLCPSANFVNMLKNNAGSYVDVFVEF